MRQAEPDMDIHTVSIGFEEQSYDERPFAGQVARKFRTCHHEHVLASDVLSVLPRLAAHYGEPFGDSSAIPTWYVSQATASHVKVALSGDGGDETFMGYGRYDAAAVLDLYRRVPRAVRSVLMEPAVGALPNLALGEAWISRLKQFVRSADVDPAERYVNRPGAFTPTMKSDLFTHDLKEALAGHSAAERFRSMHESLGSLSSLAMFQMVDFSCYLPYDILVKVDIASMAHGLEVRPPFLDHQLVEYVVSLPVDYRYRLFDRKRILRQVGYRYLDKGSINRRKRGFRIPVGQWFRTTLSAPLEGCLRESPIFSDNNLFDRQYMLRLLDEHRSGKVNHTDRLWDLWFLGEWAKQNPTARVA
jgi:asparagine synthase (glutamine-hydrolysing)